jgi:hypothetical protein
MTYNSSVTATFYLIILPLIYESEGVLMDGYEGYEGKAADFSTWIQISSGPWSRANGR